jgi:glycosyltransferase involved in cell wall biosynthesis
LIRRAGLGRLANGLRFLAAMPRLMLLSRRHLVTHIQGFERPSLGLTAMLALRLCGARMIYTAHNTFERSTRRLDRARILPALARETIVHTEADRDRVSRPPTVIPHGHYGALADAAPDANAAAAKAELGIPAGAPVVLLFGVLRPDKGLNDLLDAIVDAPPWHAVIAGEDHGGLASAATRLASPQLAGRVTVVEGFQPLDAVGRLFAAADLVALPYRRASQSGVLHLAYGFGKPVVVYPVGGLTEAVLPGVTGWVCTEPSPPALAQALREIGSLPREELGRLGPALRRWAEESFDWDEIARATEAVYVQAACGSTT